MARVRRSGRAAAGGLVYALLYRRVSSNEQKNEGLSLDVQVKTTRRYVADQAERDHAGRTWTIAGEYEDVLSGKRDDRRDYQRLLVDVRRLAAEGKQAAVVVSRLDRFGRHLLERVRVREELKRLGAETHSVREHGLVNDVMANMLAVLAEEEVERLSERVREVREDMESNGWLPPGRPALGYRLRPASDDERRPKNKGGGGAPKSVLEPEPEQAAVVRELFERVAKGESLRSAAHWLAGLPAELRGGRQCYYETVRKMLPSRAYVGQLPDGSPGNWEPLVDAAAWEQVQARIAGHQHQPHQASGQYLLTGLLRCPACGLRLHGSQRAAGRKPAVYNCGSAEHGGARAASPCYWSGNAEKLDRLVLDEVAPLVDAVSDTSQTFRLALRRAWQALARPAGEEAALVRAHEQAAGKARERIKRLALLYADGEIDREGYDLGRSQAQADLESAERYLTELRPAETPPAPPRLEDALALIGGWAGALASPDVAARRDVLGALIERVRPERIGYGRLRVEIEWTATGDLLRRLSETTHAAVA